MENRNFKPKVLITDDDMAQRLILRMTLEEKGYEVQEAEDGHEALSKLSDDIDIRFLMTDLQMPGMDGFSLIHAVREKELQYTYIIVLTSTEEREPLIRALSMGADDYLTKPVFPDELKLRLTAGSRLINLEGHEQLIFSMAKLSEYRSEETGYHLERTLHYTKLLAADLARRHPELKLSLSAAEEIARISTLHDIGKVAIPDQILHKPGRLTSGEFEIMKNHTVIGGKMIWEIYEKTRAPSLRFAYEIAMYHHEQWDGSGYPQGLAGEAIPLPARIMALADVYDALCSKRCYKEEYSHEKAISIIVAGKGKHFDPKIVDSFLRQKREWLYVKDKFADEEQD